MAYKVRFISEANADILESVAYYDAQPASTLSDRFISDIDAAVEKLTVHPKRYSYYQNTKLRSCALENFPFVLLYEIAGDEVVVYSVRHTSRDSFTA